jgi:hypothetical protein
MNVVTAFCFSVALCTDKMGNDMVIIIGTVLEKYKNSEKVSYTVRHCGIVS